MKNWRFLLCRLSVVVELFVLYKLIKTCLDMLFLRNLLILWMMVGASTVGAEVLNDSIRVLFIGNSYTYYHDMYKMVAEIASSAGQDQKVKLYYEAYTPGGCTFRRHLQNQADMSVIKRGGWDYVVLQEQSSLPAMPTDSVAKHVYPYAERLDSLIHAYNPQSKVIFYMTWGHKYGCQARHDGYPLIDSYEGMQDRLAVSYLEMAYRTGGWCAPAGLAWKRVRRERPYAMLYWPDGSHPSTLGSYLAANVIYCTIVQKHYQSHYFAGIEPELAEYIQQVAQETVLNNLKLLNISD